MPIKPKKIKLGWIKPKKQHEREVDNTQFYNSGKWRRTSTSYRQAHPTCEMDCLDEGVVGPAEVCDHKESLSSIQARGGNPYDWNLLQSGCHRCHNKKSGRESSRKGDTGQKV